MFYHNFLSKTYIKLFKITENYSTKITYDLQLMIYELVNTPHKFAN